MKHNLHRPNFLQAVLTLGILVALISVQPAQAIESGGIGGKPANPRADNPRSKSIFIYELHPGNQAQDALQVINNTDAEKQIEIYAVDSQVSSGGAFACAQKADIPTDAGTWIKLEQNIVTVAAKSNVQVPFTVTLPAKADVGEHNACIAIQPVGSSEQQSGNGVVLNFRSAIRVAVTVPGKIIKQLSIESTAVKVEKKKVAVSPVLKNDGNVSLDAKLDVSIAGPLAKKTSDGGTFPVLRGQKTSLNFELDRPFWGGWYSVTTTASYNADVSSSLGAANTGSSKARYKRLEMVQSVFIAPQPAAAALYAILAGIILSLIAFIILRSNRNKRILVRAKTYTVRKGDDIQSIAKDHQIKWRVIAKLNKLPAPYAVRTGQQLKIPASKSKLSRGE